MRYRQEDKGRSSWLRLNQGNDMQPAKKVKIGELLVQEGILTREQVAQVLTVQKVRQNIPLGELFVHSGLLTSEQLQAALEQQKKTKQKLGALLVEKGWITETVLASALYFQSQLALRPANQVDQNNKKAQGKFADLVNTQRLTQQELEAAITKAQEAQRPIETVLMEKYKLTKREIGDALRAFYNCPFIADVQHLTISPDLVHRISPSYLKANYWVPLRETKDSIEVLIDDPHAFHKLQDIKRLFPGKEIRCAVGLPDDILRYAQALTELTPQVTTDSISTILHQLEIEGPEEQQEEETAEPLIDENDSAIVRLVNQIVSSGYKKGASDIHIEPGGEKQETRVRFRVDGDCFEYLKLPAAYRRALVSRLKIMAHLDIAERRKPQDGKIKFRLAKREIELRVATIPTAGSHNEDVVMRILDNTQLVPLHQLSMSERNLHEFTQLLQKPYGLFLCVGPTGAGKTTTLHSALSFLNTPNRKIWTAEDPVEITQPGLRQVQVNHKIGFNFAAALRAFLRADPDIIMVGEIRDQETAEVSLRASLTGHLVLSTLHTNNAVETVTRFLDMGIDPFHFADALLGVLAQRLARTLCRDCKEPYHPPHEEYEALAHAYGEEAFARLGIPYEDSLQLFRATGCETCQQTGYKGRIGLHELLVVTEDLAHLIHERATKADLLRVALAQGMTTLMQDGIAKVLQGWTDYSQVKTVTMR